MNTGSVLAQFTITLSNAVPEPVSVEWFTSDGTAKAGVDYAANKGTAIFAPGDTQKTVEILVFGRAVGSEDRSFFVEMLPPTNAILGASIGECIIHVDTSGSQPVTQIIVPTGPKGDKGESTYQTWLALPGNAGKTEQDFINSLKPSPQEIAQEVAPLLDVGDTVLTAEGTESLIKPDQTTVKAVARRVAYAAQAKIATLTLADGDNTIAPGNLTGDVIDFAAAGFVPRIFRGGSFSEPTWQLNDDGKITIYGAVAGDVLYGTQYDVISNNNSRKSITDALKAITEPSLYHRYSSFESGSKKVKSATDALLWENAPSGQGPYFIWQGALPKVVPAGSTPLTNGGIGEGKWMPVSSATLRGDMKAGFKDLLINQPDTKDFWTDVHPNAKVHRMNNRLFMGGASKNDGKILTERNLQNKDWLEALFRSSTTNNTQFGCFSDIGQCAILGASRTSDSGLADSLGCIGGQFWGINDNTTQLQTSYAAYFEARRFAGAGRTHGFEVDMINFGTAVGVQPYDMFQQGLTAGIWLASGGELTATKASAAIAIMNNGSTWDKGIVFHSTSLEGTDGISGFGVAMEMAKNQGFRWMFGDGSVGATVSSSVSTAVTTQSLNFSDGGLLYRNVQDKVMFQIGVSNNYVNGISMTPGPSGIGPTFSVQGDDLNIDLRLATKGTGLIDLRGQGVVSSGGAPYGDLTLKINGEVVRIAVKK